MKNVYIIGKPSLPLIDFLIKNNYNIGAFNEINSNYQYPKLIQEIHHFDILSKQDTLNLLRKEDFKLIPNALISRYENDVIAKTWIGEYFNLNVPTEEAVLAASDKFLMRQKFLNYDPNITPHFKLVKSFKDIINFMTSHNYPVILKPTNLFKSLLVTKNNNLAELKINYQKSINQINKIYKKYNVTHREPNLVIEEFLEGPSFSVEAFALKDKVYTTDIVDLIMARDINITDNYNYSRKLPSPFSKDKQKEIKQVAIKGMKALNLQYSAGHCEIIYTKKGPKIIEIGARIGGYRTRMFNLAQGIDLDKAEIDIALNKTPNLKKTISKYCAVYELFPDKKGKFQKITNLNKISKLKSLNYISIKYKKNETIGLSKDGYKFTAVIILVNSNKNQFDKDCNFVEYQVKVLTK